jgi:hypothetical protein
MVQLAAVVWMGRPMFLLGGALAYGLGVAMGAWQTGSVAWGPAVGKRSLAVIAGDRVRLLHHGLLAFAYLLALLLTGPILPVPVMAALLLSLPLSLWAALTFTRKRAPLPSTLAMAAAIGAAVVGWIAAAQGL